MYGPTEQMAPQNNNKKKLVKDSDEYLHKRSRNNLAVKRSRTKSKLKMQQTLERVEQLKVENGMLEEKIKMLSKELSFLKDIFMAHAGSAHGMNLADVDLNTLLQDDHSDPQLHTAEDDREDARIQSLQAGEKLHLGEEDFDAKGDAHFSDHEYAKPY